MIIKFLFQFKELIRIAKYLPFRSVWDLDYLYLVPLSLIVAMNSAFLLMNPSRKKFKGARVMQFKAISALIKWSWINLNIKIMA